MLGVLAAPTPFLLGVHTAWLRDLQGTPEVEVTESTPCFLQK
jgi:hypothetical protein